jgi:3-phenylpropionate/trans-cinnamate dioxygenase ferredoxin subunit
VPPGGAITVELHGRRVAVVNHRGTFYAVDGDCSHARGPLAEGRVEGACLLACPWHGAAFDLRTGRVARGPARKPVSTYQVKVSDGVLYLSA